MAYIMNNIQFAEKIKELYKNRDKWTYMYESTGYVVGVDTKVKNYFDYFKSQGWIKEPFNWDTWSKENYGKQCTDCSNTMNYTLWGKGCACYYSSKAPKTWPQLDMNKPMIGAVAWKEGHVGYITKIQDGMVTFVHMPSMGKTFTEFTKPIGKDDYWLGYAKCPHIEYLAATPKSIAAYVLKEFKVGDTFKAEDALIEVTMSDGSTLINPAYWTATPLKITKLPQEMTFKYQNVSCKVVLPDFEKKYKVTISQRDLTKFKELFPNSTYEEV